MLIKSRGLIPTQSWHLDTYFHLLSRGDIHNWGRMVRIQWCCVACCCTGILLLLSNLPNCLVCNWHNIAGKLQFLGSSVLFVHLFGGDMLFIVLSGFLGICRVLPWTLMQIVVLCPILFSLGFHRVSRCYSCRVRQFPLMWSQQMLEWSISSLSACQWLLALHYYFWTGVVVLSCQP